MLPIGYVLAETYEIIRLIGQGGMACVYEVRHVRLPARFAVKVITGDISQDSKFLKRFRQEAEILARLEHPHVIRVLDWHQTKEGQPCLVMEFLEGGDLSQRLRRTGAMVLGEALPIFLQIGDAIQAAHDQGVIHRDLKPANIYLLKEGAFPNYAKVLDFGIAKSVDACSALRTKDAGLMGTPAYMAPEQARGLPASIRTDQFALALILYEMLLGRTVFDGADLLQTLARVLFDEPPPVPYPQIDKALRRAVSKDPKDRFPSIRDFIAATEAMDQSIIRPLFTHTRPLARTDPDDVDCREKEQASQSRDDIASAAKRDDDGPSTIRACPDRNVIAGVAGRPPTAPLPAETGEASGGPAAAHPPTLSRPSITGQRISAEPPRLQSRLLKAALGSVGAAVALVALSLLLNRRVPSVPGQLPSPPEDMLIRDEGSPDPPPAPSDLAVAVSVDLAPLPEPKRALVLSSAAEEEQPGNSRLHQAGAASKPGPHRVVPRPIHSAGNRTVAAAPKLTVQTIEFALQGELTKAQKDFILGCARWLGVEARAAVIKKPLELWRSNRRFVFDTESIPEHDGEVLERCLNEMSDQMLLPRSVQITMKRSVLTTERKQ